MARSWEWFWTTNTAPKNSDGGFSVTYQTEGYEGWALQRIVGQGAFWNSMSYASAINPQHYLPIPFRYQCQVKVSDGSTQVSEPIKREGLAQTQIWEADNDAQAAGWATWAMPVGSFDYDVTLRHTFTSNGGGLISHYASIVPAIPTNLPDFKLPDGDWGGTWYTGMLFSHP